jgi:hypothetical protein
MVLEFGADDAGLDRRSAPPARRQEHPLNGA